LNTIAIALRASGFASLALDLERIRQEIESFDYISAIYPEVRGIVKRNWPHLQAAARGRGLSL
jgi:hypothetical protein